MKTDGQHDKPEDSLLSAATLEEDIARHIRFTMGRDPAKPNRHAAFMGLAFAVRDRLIAKWVKTQRALYETLSKRVYFLSLEFLPGRYLWLSGQWT